jgi:hypothetical protein
MEYMTNATLSRGPAVGRRAPAPAAAAAPKVRPAARDLDPVIARLLLVASAAMLPWLAYLAVSLPPHTVAAHWDAVWVGLDTAETAGLLTTGLLLRRRDPRRSLTAAATSVLLAVDAWFDCGTAVGGERPVALTLAFALELPLAAGLAVLAWRAFPTTHPTEEVTR